MADTTDHGQATIKYEVILFSSFSNKSNEIFENIEHFEKQYINQKETGARYKKRSSLLSSSSNVNSSWPAVLGKNSNYNICLAKSERRQTVQAMPHSYHNGIMISFSLSTCITYRIHIMHISTWTCMYNICNWTFLMWILFLH